MPLKKSKSEKAFKSNVKTEYETLLQRGLSKKKALKQSLAIAYSVKRK